MNKIKYIYILDIMNKNKKYKGRGGVSNPVSNPVSNSSTRQDQTDNLRGLSTINIQDFITKINTLQRFYSP